MVLAPERRAALIDWAARNGALVVEDDYDAEYRYDRAPVGRASRGSRPSWSPTRGSVSKTLAPGLRLGWLVAPERLAARRVEAKATDDLGTPVVEQLALADFLERGELDRHLRRTRTVYRARRDALVAALARHLPGCEPAGVAAGLHLVVHLPPGADERGRARARPARPAWACTGCPSTASSRARPRCCSATAGSRRPRSRRGSPSSPRPYATPMSYEHLIWEQDGGVGQITLNRPETRSTPGTPTSAASSSR